MQTAQPGTEHGDTSIPPVQSVSPDSDQIEASSKPQPSLRDLLMQIQNTQNIRTCLIQQKILHEKQAEAAAETSKIAWHAAESQPYSRYWSLALEATQKAESAQKRADTTAGCLKEATEIIEAVLAQHYAMFPAQESALEDVAAEFEDLPAQELKGLAIIHSAKVHGGSLDLKNTNRPYADTTNTEKINDYSFPPSHSEALHALADIHTILKPTLEDKKEKKYSEFRDLDLLTRCRLEDMRVLLGSYANDHKSITWKTASLHVSSCSE